MLGQVMVFGGEGKGKTSAALGTVLRFVCSGGNAAWVSWYKSSEWSISEKRAVEFLPGLDMFWYGKGFYFADGEKKKRAAGAVVRDMAEAEAHKAEAGAAMDKVREVLKKGEAEMVVMDEVLNAVADGLIAMDDLIELISKRGGVHLVLTGRAILREIVEAADMVSEIRKVKHPFDRGQLAVKGLDF